VLKRKFACYTSLHVKSDVETRLWVLTELLAHDRAARPGRGAWAGSI
jgi:hypothetical protein